MTATFKAWIFSALLGLSLPLCAAQQPGLEVWLDDMPPVHDVVRVVRQYTNQQIQQYPQLAANEDYFPIQLVGTFVLLRWIMEIKVLTDGALSVAGEARRRDLVRQYQLAEFTLGSGTAQRNGYIRSECAKNANKVHYKQFPSAQACHGFLMGDVTSNVYPSFKFRQAVLPMLLCDRAAVYLELMQKYILEVPSPERSAAATGRLPDGASVAQAEGFCSTFGGDATRNGLCDQWENATGATPARSDAAQGCPVLRLKRLRAAADGGLLVEIDSNNVQPGTTLRLRVKRSSQSTLDATATDLWQGDAIVQSDAGNAAARVAIIAPDPAFSVDGAKPFLHVEALVAHAGGAVSCEQPSTQWDIPRHTTMGLHGPYGTVVEAMRRDHAASYAMRLPGSTQKERGFVIMGDLRAPARYFTTPPRISSDQSDLVPGTQVQNPQAQPLFLVTDYEASMMSAFTQSCERIEDYYLAAIVHSHPNRGLVSLQFDTFSPQDYQLAINLKRSVPRFEQAILINTHDRAILGFAPNANDQDFAKEELDSFLYGNVPYLSDLWNDYRDPARTRTLCIMKEGFLPCLP